MRFKLKNKEKRKNHYLDYLRHLSIGIKNESRYEVTVRDIAELKKINDDNEIQLLQNLRKDLNYWLKTYKDILIFQDQKKHTQSFDEIYDRAKEFVDLALRKKKTNLMYIDGHGRLTYCLLLILKERDLLSKIKLQCVEIEPNMHQWHQYIFPKEVESIEGDFFKLFTESFQETMKRTCFYLNFCGIQKYAPITASLIKNHDAVMVSLSSRCGCPKEDKNCDKCKFIRLCQECGEKPQNSNLRGLFHTYIFENSLKRKSSILVEEEVEIIEIKKRKIEITGDREQLKITDSK